MPLSPSDTLAAFCQSSGIRVTVVYGAPPRADFHNADGWTVTIRKGRRSMRVPFYMGSGHNGREPGAADVLPCLVSDSEGVENARDFADWCAEYGYDTDSRRAHATYTACRNIARRLKNVVGDDYADLVTACSEL